ncbi:hypothetical protein X777_05935 [Ooceraea biroi]|uniref:Uncharacterized protein n=1 Tax=Ooceraea biroi TaxID=2015173 RepID=A0A026WEK1_OOCBI|nr:hypothetical protein X777_05935 [Ooceraea biroi]
MAFAAARMILKDKRRKPSKEDFAPRNRSKVKNCTRLCYQSNRLCYHFRVITAPSSSGLKFMHSRFARKDKFQWSLSREETPRETRFNLRH